MVRETAQSFTRRYEMVRETVTVHWRPAPEKIRSKNERLSAQTLTRRYEMVRNTVTDRAPRAFKEQALGSRRAERASPEKAEHSEQANQTPSQGGVRVAFFPVHEEDL